ncbi:MAG TPA: hypothetical protein VN223_09270, partial [Candidatus Elarobacter sp.]|nr:hypothetical protein [Candidatus Elarobacter sp.]
TLVVDQKREVDPGFFTEEPGITHITQANYGKTGAFLLELFFEFAQLRDVFSAEDSTVVAKEDEHRWSAMPQGTEARWIAVGVRQRNLGQLAAERFRHDGHSLDRLP